MGIEVFCESKHDDPFANLRFNVGEQAAHVRARDVGDLFAAFIAPLRSPLRIERRPFLFVHGCVR